MKRLTFILILSISPIGLAQENVAGGFEAGGHIFVGAGWQRYRTQANTTIAPDVRGTFPGVIGSYADSNNRGNRINRQDDFRFFLDEVELDIAKTFGEGIRLRADLDFGEDTLNSGARFTNAGGAADHANILVEQIHGTVAIGNKLEILLGRFNAPIGFEKNDVSDAYTIGRSTIYRALRPTSFTGVKFYYPFTDATALHLFAANNGLTHDDGDVFAVDTDIPSGGFRLEYLWGEEWRRSRLGGSGAFGQDHGNFKSGFTFLGDVDWEWWVTDQLALGGEAVYRQIDTRTAGRVNGKYVGGLLNFHYVFDPEYSVTLKYAFAYDVNGTAEVISVLGTGAQSLTGNDQQLHEVFANMHHPITDRVVFTIETGYTFMDRQGPNNQQVFSAAGGFAYHF